LLHKSVVATLFKERVQVGLSAALPRCLGAP
jgi:hypothetical protein